jgi:hypothetical protein
MHRLTGILIGFFREYTHSEHDPSIHELVNAPSPEKTSILAYLQAGSVIGYEGWDNRDVMDTRIQLPFRRMQSDGRYTWPDDLAYYVERYDVRLPDSFIAHAKSLGWKPPIIDSDAIATAEDDAEFS